MEWADWSPDGTSLLVVRTVDNENRIEYPAGKVVFKLRYRAGSANLGFPEMDGESLFASTSPGAMIAARWRS